MLGLVAGREPRGVRPVTSESKGRLRVAGHLDISQQGHVAGTLPAGNETSLEINLVKPQDGACFLGRAGSRGAGVRVPSWGAVPCTGVLACSLHLYPPDDETSRSDHQECLTLPGPPVVQEWTMLSVQGWGARGPREDFGEVIACGHSHLGTASGRGTWPPVDQRLQPAFRQRALRASCRSRDEQSLRRPLQPTAVGCWWSWS